ncbi:LytR/AlgR family response regulator transcription factor [Anaerosporobacter faecicola]|uniref:LytR/AlgR family response regulator transcription factor n=1 Tax=Anaerosporobacter faecicola TaxID=2718714 RepID=UPI001439317D|nr:LytTR family DNA-binding domain-containing protein [Anaerosporobacter faecicola]
MLNITICENDIFTCSFIEDTILKYTNRKNIKVDIGVFYKGETLYKYLNKTDYNYISYIDILFIDTELKELSGIDVGNYIRNELKNELIQIVYISNSDSYAMKLFKIRPFDFLLKPLKKCEIIEVLDKILNLKFNTDIFFEYYIKGSYFKVALDNIIYFKSEGKKVNIVTKKLEENKQFYGKISNVQKVVNPQNFLLVHKSFLVQYKYIVNYTYNSLEMITGEIIPISQANRKSVRLTLQSLRQN